MVSWDKIKREIYVNKEGILLGAIAGLLATIYLNMTGEVDLSLATQSVSLLDPLVEHLVGTGMSIKDLALTKLGTALILIGIFVGYLIDKMIYPKK